MGKERTYSELGGSSEGVAVDAADTPVEGARGGRGAQDELGGVGRVVVLVQGDTEAVALSDDLLDGGGSGGELGGAGGLLLAVGASQVDGLAAVVGDGDEGGAGRGSESDDAGDGGGETHDDGCWWGRLVVKCVGGVCGNDKVLSAEDDAVNC